MSIWSTKSCSMYGWISKTKTKALWDRFEFVYVPKHGSWLNIAEIELNVLTGQYLKRRMDNIEVVRKEALAWQKFRNNKSAKVNWLFTTEDARIKSSRLYPSLEDWRGTTTDYRKKFRCERCGSKAWVPTRSGSEPIAVNLAERLSYVSLFTLL